MGTCVLRAPINMTCTFNSILQSSVSSRIVYLVRQFEVSIVFFNVRIVDDWEYIPALQLDYVAGRHSTYRCLLREVVQV